MMTLNHAWPPAVAAKEPAGMRAPVWHRGFMNTAASAASVPALGAAGLAVTRQVRVALRRVGVAVSRVVAASGQVDLVVGAAEVLVEFYRAGHEAHRVAAAADGAGVGVAGVHQLGVVQRAVV